MQYEVKVSYPSSYPTNYQISFKGANRKLNQDALDLQFEYIKVATIRKPASNLGGRQLLNADKVIFAVDSEGKIVDRNCNYEEARYCLLEITAYAEGVSVKVDTKALDRPYNVMWERVYFGGVPSSSFRAMFFIFTTFVLLIYVIVPYIKRALPRRVLKAIFSFKKDVE